MKKTLVLTFSFIILFSDLLIGQSRIYPFNITLDYHLFLKRLNPFSLSNNPALLQFDETDELLHINSNLVSASGKFKTNFEPEISNLTSLTFSGKKSLGNSQIFKGSFSFLKDERKNWNWIFSKNYRNGNSFLLGDSSSGYSRFNAIQMEASYFNKLTDKFSFGVTLNYLVDEGLKTVSPRPTSNHRDISIRIGTDYEFSEDLITAVSFSVGDYLEEISYKEDEGSVLKEISLLKFRGFDYPVIVKKKTETRAVYENTYDVNVDLFYLLHRSLNVGLNINSGILHSTIKEDFINPKSQGYFQRKHNSQLLMINYKPIYELETQLIFSNYNSNFWSRHPDFKVMLSDNSISDQNALLKIYYHLKSSSINLNFGVQRFSTLIDDYYSDVFSKVKSTAYMAGVGFGSQIFQNVSFNTAYNFRRYIPSEKSLSYSTPSSIFANYFVNDFSLINSTSTEHIFYSTIDFKSRFGLFTLNIYGSYLKPDERSTNYRFSSQVSLEYKLKVY